MTFILRDSLLFFGAEPVAVDPELITVDLPVVNAARLLTGRR